MQTPSRIACMLALWTLAAARPVLAGQPLETETARLIPAHSFEVESGFEMQSSSFGHETAVPLAFGYGITDRLELLVEPVPYTSIHDPAGVRAQGQGDLEITLTSRVHPEGPRAPALAIAGEIKLPVAESPIIGSEDRRHRLVHREQAGSRRRRAAQPRPAAAARDRPAALAEGSRAGLLVAVRRVPRRGGLDLLARGQHPGAPCSRLRLERGGAGADTATAGTP